MWFARRTRTNDLQCEAAEHRIQEARGASHVRLWLTGRAECLWQRRPDEILDCVWRVMGATETRHS